MKLKELIQRIVYTSNFYVALVISILIGGLGGALVGILSGIFIGRDYIILGQCPAIVFGHELHIDHLNLYVGGIAGSIIGAIVAGGSTSLVISYLLYDNPKLTQPLNQESIKFLIKYCFLASIAINLGMILGAVIAGSSLPPFGPILGAVLGFLMMTIVTLVYTKNIALPR